MSQDSTGPWSSQGPFTCFYPLLRDFNDRVFLIHAHRQDNQLSAALLVVDGCIDDDWITVSDQSLLEGERIDVRLPVEIQGQYQRHKAYDVVLPLKAR